MKSKALASGFGLVLIFVVQMSCAQQGTSVSQLAEMRAQADKGDATAQFYIGFSYFQAKDYAEAVPWWRKRTVMPGSGKSTVRNGPVRVVWSGRARND